MSNRTASPQHLEMFAPAAATFVIEAVDHAGDPITLTGLTLRFVVYTAATAATGLWDVEDGSIAKADNVATVSVAAGVAAAAGPLKNERWVLWDLTNSRIVAHGSITVESAVVDV